MPWTGSAPNQSYQRSDGVRTGAAVNAQAKAAAVNNTAALADTREQDMAAAISLCLKIDGGTQPSVDLPMNAFKHTGVGAGAARSEYARLDQVQDGALMYAEAGGTANAITLTTDISCDPVEGMVIGFVAEADNSAATTVALNGGSALALQVAGAACTGGEVQNTAFHQIGFDGTQWQLLNPLGGVLTSSFQPLDADLTAIAALAPANDDVMQRKGGVWTNRTIAQLLVDLAAPGTTFQPLDADLTAIAALTTTAFGRSLLAAADAAALRVLAGATLTDAIFPGALVAIIQDQKSSGTQGGGFSSGADRTRTLNTLAYNRNTAVSLASDQFTLPAGSWEIEWSAPGYRCEGHQSMLYDVTGTAVAARGTSEISDDAQTDPPQTRSVGSARVTVAAPNTYEIRHRCASTQTTNGLGVAGSFGTEVYTRVVIRAA